jgi:hypothetical protein
MLRKRKGSRANLGCAGGGDPGTLDGNASVTGYTESVIPAVC